MAITLTSPPRSPSLATDPNYVVFTTNIPTASQQPGFLISGVASDGDVLNLRWGTSIVRMTFAAAPDNSGTQIRAAAGQGLVDYLAQLMEGFFSVPAIESAFAITLRNDGVRLVLRDSLIGDLNATSSASITVSIFGGDSANDYPNLSAALIVYMVGRVEPIGRFKAAYNRAGQTQFNIASLLGLRLGLPTLGENYTVEEPGGMAEYFFRYADQYGRPPQPEKLTKSATYVAVAGGSAGDTLLRWGGSGNLQICHAYFNARDQLFAKPISPTQPDWLWLYVNGTASATPTIDVTFTDGTTASRAVSGAVSMDRGLYCFPSGPAQCGIEQTPGYDTKEVARYAFRLAGAGPSIIYDLLPDCHPWEVIIAYENGAGGIETLAMRGKAERNYSSTSQAFTRARPQVQRTDEGATQRYQVEGRKQWTLRSSFYSADYIEHLRQLTVGRTWIVDQLHNRFIEVLPNTGTLRLTKDDDDLHALELSFTSATPDRNAHNL